MKERIQTEKDTVVRQQLRIGSFVVYAAAGLHLTLVFKKLQLIKQARYRRFKEYVTAVRAFGFFRMNIQRNGRTRQ